MYFSSLPSCVKPSAGDVMFVDVGVYGHSVLPHYAGKDEVLRKFERFTLEHKGFQALYAETLLSREEFQTMFPREMYDQVNTRSYNQRFYFNLIMSSGEKKVPRDH